MNIRRATVEDCMFVSTIILEAETSGAEITSYEKMFRKERDELATAFAAVLPASPDGHALTWKTFFIAEENGKELGALSAYVEGSNGDSSHLTTAVLMSAFPRKEVMEAFKLLRTHPEVSIPKKDHTMQIDCVATLPESRGKGVLRALINAVEDSAREQQVNELQIQVWKKNTGAIAAYERLGFSVELECLSVSDPGNGKVLMSKKI